MLRHNQKGAAILEFAIVLPFLLVLVFGMIEFGLIAYNKQVITNASREGARWAIGQPSPSKDPPEPRRSTDSVKAVVTDYWNNNKLINFASGDPEFEIKIKDKKHFIRQLIYESKLTNADLICKMKEIKINSSDSIYADSAEMQRIEEISKAGFNIYPAVKSIRDGIDFVKRHKLNIHSSSTDIINEIKQYKWKQDKNGRVLDEPVKFLDHSIDAIRYALYTHQKSNHQLKIAFL